MKITKEIWDTQYQQGVWNYLPSESARNEIIGNLCKKCFSYPTILDVGCGFGNLVEYLTFQTYLGIDISHVPLPSRKREKVEFQSVSAEEFDTEKRFEIIIFNEILYYINAIKILEKYEQFLSDQGVFIISMWEHPKTLILWEKIKRGYGSVEWRSVSDAKNTWNIGVLRRNFNKENEKMNF